jgi:Peptidase A4 family
MNTKSLLPLAVVVILVASVVGFFALAPPVTTHRSGPSLPALSSPTHMGHVLTSATPLGDSAAAPSEFTCTLAASECYYSINWAGYAVYSTSYAVTKVVGTWTVPTISGVSGTSCPDSQRTWDSNAVWVGIDGFSATDPTVEQTGTSSDCFYGHVSYYAWYEFYPSASVVSSKTVSPGDSITATVMYAGLNATGVPAFKTMLHDSTAGWWFNSTRTGVPGAARQSAEWIDESPYFDGFLGLTHVSVVKFTGATATIGGVTGGISHWGSNVYWMITVDYAFFYYGSGYQTLFYSKAQPSALLSSGKGFTLAWISGGP